MCKQKFKLSLLFFIFFLFFLFSNGHPQPLALLFCFLIAVGLWGLEEYWKHRSFGKARPLFLGSLFFFLYCPSRFYPFLWSYLYSITPYQPVSLYTAESPQPFRAFGDGGTFPSLRGVFLSVLYFYPPFPLMGCLLAIFDSSDNRTLFISLETGPFGQ